MSNFVRTFKRRKAFLDALAAGSSVSLAAAAGDGSVSAFRRWREADPEFGKDWDDAIEEGTDVLEDAAYARAVSKSDALAMFMLKARRPEKFDRGSKLELTGGINVEGSKQKLLNKLARLAAAGKVLPSGQPEESGLPEGEPSSSEQQVPLLPAPQTHDGGLSVRGRKRSRQAA